MRIVHYCQHVLGVGHLFRSLEIASALAGHEVWFVTGGADADVAFPPHVRPVRLPGLMMDEEFAALLSVEGDPEEVMRERREKLLALFSEVRPDVFLVELYPFGRRRFEFELLPVLEACRQGRFGKVRVACSLRDILVEKNDREKYERRVLDRLNTLFDAVLVHADQLLQTLDETFSRTRDIRVPVVYTGFVTPRPSPGARERLRAELGLSGRDQLVLASAGGGKVGAPLLASTLEAAGRLATSRPLRLQVFTGPYMDEERVAELVAGAYKRPGFKVDRFTRRFPDWLAASDLSVSMAGYNTCMNLLAAGAFGLVWPFGQNREQRLRAMKLSSLGCLDVLEDADLAPAKLARRMRCALDRSVDQEPSCRARAAKAPLDLDGAANTARWIEAWHD